MANYLDANPSDRPMIEWHRTASHGLVPIALRGEFAAMVNPRSIARYSPATPLPVADYVVGLELLGNRFSIFRDSRGRQRVGVIFPMEERPPSWVKREQAIEAAFGAHSSRADELVEFLLERDGDASL